MEKSIYGSEIGQHGQKSKWQTNIKHGFVISNFAKTYMIHDTHEETHLWHYMADFVIGPYGHKSKQPLMLYKSFTSHHHWVDCDIHTHIHDHKACFVWINMAENLSFHINYSEILQRQIKRTKFSVLGTDTVWQIVKLTGMITLQVHGQTDRYNHNIRGSIFYSTS
jgi:hypothetical protein